MISARSLLSIVMLSLSALSGAAQTSKLSSVLNMPELIHDWEISKQFTLDVANSMPAEDYGFRPSPEEMTFGEQMLHIAVSNAYRFREITAIATPFTIDSAAHHCRATAANVAHPVMEGTQ